jgi:hypothetical protein
LERHPRARQEGKLPCLPGVRLCLNVEQGLLHLIVGFDEDSGCLYLLPRHNQADGRLQEAARVTLKVCDFIGAVGRAGKRLCHAVQPVTHYAVYHRRHLEVPLFNLSASILPTEGVCCTSTVLTDYWLVLALK